VKRRASLLLGHALLAPLTVLTVLGACSAQPSSTTPAPQGGVATKMTGSDVYLVSCARCHGDDRMGKTDAPKLDVVRMSTLGDAPLKMTISYGKGRMPAFGGLSQDQVDALVTYLRGQ
jgi:quinoprotein glucose dehydrogenase